MVMSCNMGIQQRNHVFWIFMGMRDAINISNNMIWDVLENAVTPSS